VSTTHDVDAALTRVAREESGRVLAILARTFRDLDLADEAVQDALATAARTWPVDGIPNEPARLVVHRCPQSSDRPSPSRQRSATSNPRRSARPHQPQ
jgi:predicted RNA polymerase sigma factor